MGLRMMPFFKGKKGFQFAGGGNVDKFDDLPVATTSSIGCVKADGTTINVNSSGTISTTALLKKSTMPDPFATEFGNIYMYTGADTASLTSGHVYKCVSDEDPDTPTYSWAPVELEDPYTLPVASASTLGGVKVGDGLSVDSNGVLSKTNSNTQTVITNLLNDFTGSVIVNNTNSGFIQIQIDVVAGGSISSWTDICVLPSEIRANNGYDVVTNTSTKTSGISQAYGDGDVFKLRVEATASSGQTLRGTKILVKSN